MRIMVGDAMVDAPAHKPQPGRVVVDVEAGAVLLQPSSRSPRDVVELVRDRFGVATTTLRLDGPAVVLEKARHMFKREAAGTHRQYAMFAGAGPDGPVAGFSLTHPRLSDQVLTRPAQVWPRGADVAPELAALALWGGCVLSALEAGPLGVLGDGLLADLARHLGGSDSADAWLSPGLPEMPDERQLDLVVGCVGTEAQIAAAFPNARRVLARSPEAIVRTDDRDVDLFYEDGDVEYPAWFRLEHCAAYLDVVAGLPFAGAGDAGVRFERFAAGRPSGTTIARRTAASRAAVTVGVVGAGRWPLGMVARQMELIGGVRLKTVHDRRPEACHFAMGALPFEQATTEPEAILEDPEIDVVVVAPYHGAHAEVGTAALRAGKHCFLEKPAAVTFDQFWALADAAAASDKVLHVGNNRRFAPFVGELQSLLAEADGPTTVQSYMRAITIPPNSWYYWPSQGSRVISNVCHIVDLAIALTGNADPVEVETRGALGDPVLENVSVAVTFGDGSLANLVYTNRGKSLGEYYERHVVARGARTGEIEHFRRLKLLGDRVTTRRGVQDFGHRAQIDLFLKAVRGERPQPVDLRTLLVSAYSALAADQSVREGHPVAVPHDRIDAALRPGADAPGSPRA